MKEIICGVNVDRIEYFITDYLNKTDCINCIRRFDCGEIKPGKGCREQITRFLQLRLGVHAIHIDEMDYKNGK